MTPDVIETLEKAINEVTDKDWSWWPFLWLRPDPHERLSLPRLAVVALLFGLPCGVCLATALSFAGPKAHPTFFMAAFPMLLFFIATALVGPMWNRRAERLIAARVRAPRG
jgi:hypothetical protein